MTPSRITKVWDLPTRLFHWTLVVAVAGAYATAKAGMIDWHFRCGYAVLALVLFRIIWGLIGSDTARFVRFVRGPRAALSHLAHFPRREPDAEVGHNAAGGLMVVGLLVLLAIQAGTGLFANDGLFSEGPFAALVDPAISDRLTQWHEFNFNLILAAVIMHVLAVIAYALVKRHDLVRPMVTGKKRLPATIPAPRIAPLWRAVLVAAAAVGAVWAVAGLG